MSFANENNYVQQRWQKLSIESKRLLAQSLQERAYLVLLWRLEYRAWMLSNQDDPYYEERA